MPSGKTHRRIDLVMLLVIVGAAVYFWAPLAAFWGRDNLAEYGAIFVIAYLFGTFLLSPDMDLHTSDPMKNWGVLQLVWRPYAALFKHRGLSHTPIIGTLTRVVYILLVAYGMFAAANMLFDMGWKMSLRDVTTRHLHIISWGFCGLFLPDFFHIIADRLFKNKR